MTHPYSDPTEGFTQVKPTTIAGKIIQFPLIRLILAIVFMAPASIAYQWLGVFLRDDITNKQTDIGIIVTAVVGIVLLIFFYSLFCRLVEKRSPVEFSINGALPEFIKGSGLAVLLIGLSLSIIMLLSDFTIVTGGKGPLILIVSFFTYLTPALFEEIIFRLILFRLTEEWLGSWPAVAIQALFFGFAHAGNPGATLISSISIVISAGALLAAIYLLTRRIWMVWGVHLFWNYLQSALFGLPVSGGQRDGLLHTHLTGSEWITGGKFGIEASVVTVLVCSVFAVFYYSIVIKQKRLVSPSWVRKEEEVSLAESDSIVEI